MSRSSKQKAPLQTGDAVNPSAGGETALTGASPTPWIVPGICVLLAAMVWAVYAPTLHHQFVSYDDNVYVTDNAVVKKGLTLQGFAWALTYGKIGHWHPLTWLSHMLDCQFYGQWAGGHHLTNVLLHAASAILLFLLLRRMTGAPWRSAFVAAVFAVHPLHVESVAWVAERKDVLGGFFFMLTLGAYARYAQSPASRARYFTVIALFTLGLMSKNMLVTLPFVLLLLDYWPLGRWNPGAEDSVILDARGGALFPLVIEKIPLFALSAASCVITCLVPEKLSAVETMPLLLRLENALVSCVIYLRQMVWPAGLAVPYPNPAGYFPWYEVLAALALLAAISATVFFAGKKRPWLVVGWLWYVGMLAPVVGIVQISTYAHADRYTYLPQIGLYIAAAWLAAEVCARLRHGRLIAGCVSAILLAALMIAARIQVSYWKDDPTLWLHTLAVMPDNAVAHNNLGCDLEDDNLMDAAAAHFQKAVEISPDYASAHYNLANLLAQKGDVNDAIAHYQKAIESEPGYTEAHNNLGLVFLQKGKVDEAITHFQKAVETDPGYAAAYDNLGLAFLQSREVEKAIIQFEKALQITPRDTEAQNNLAYVLATCPRASLRNGAKALDLAQQASQSTGGGNPIVLRTLAAAYAETGQFPQAVETAQLALKTAIAQSNTALVDALRSQIMLYQARTPLRDNGPGN